MFPASSKQSGNCLGVPDTCKTPAPPAPPVPIPYPNMGMCATAMKMAQKIFICNMPALNLMSEIPMSQGDEAGVAGGVVSGANMQKITYKKGSANVFIEGKPAVHLMSITGHNGMNANMPAGQQIAPSQVKVILMS
ncbi:MAG: DUF4150 domain-containing protein [Planctomycetota bacterium]